MENMIGIVRPGPQIDTLTKYLLILSSAYGVPLCSYNLFDLNLEQQTTPAIFWCKGSLEERQTALPAFSEFQFSRTLADVNEGFKQRMQWLREHTSITDNPAIAKEHLSQAMLRSAFSIYAIPTYRVTTMPELRNLTKIIPNAIIKPSGGRKGIGVMHVHCSGTELTMREKEKCWTANDDTWSAYVQFLSENRMGVPIIQPRLDFSLDDRHAVDFRLLVARGGSGNWETVAIYPRIGATRLVSNVAQGGYIGDAMEVLETIAPGKASELMELLEYIATELPELIQSYRQAPIAALGIDVGIDRGSLQPYVLEANSRPSTKLHAWLLAEKKTQYYKYLLERQG